MIIEAVVVTDVNNDVFGAVVVVVAIVKIIYVAVVLLIPLIICSLSFSSLSKVLLLL